MLYLIDFCKTIHFFLTFCRSQFLTAVNFVTGPYCFSLTVCWGKKQPVFVFLIAMKKMMHFLQSNWEKLFSAQLAVPKWETKEKVLNLLFEAGLQTYVKFKFIVSLINKSHWQCLNEETKNIFHKAYLFLPDLWKKLLKCQIKSMNSKIIWS